MACYIGSITFEEPPDLIWINEDEPFVAGCDIRTRSGDMVSIRPHSVSQNYLTAKLKFHWLSYAEVQVLRGYWRLGGTYSAKLEPNGAIKTVRFAAKDGVANVKHEAWGEDVIHEYLQDAEGDSYDTDLYSGDINLIIEAV